MGKLFTTGWYDRVEALLALALAKSASSATGSNTVWTDFAAGSVINLAAATPYASFDSSGAQSTANLPAAPTNGQVQTIRVAGNMASPLIVNAQGAGITVELLNDLGTFGASTWLPIQGQVVAFKYDGTAGVKAWKLIAQSMPGGGQASYNPGWYAQTTIFVDPQDLSTTALDSNTGTSSGAALRTWGEVQRRYGTVSPLLRVSPTVTFLSSHTDGSDPVLWTPIMFNGGLPKIIGNTPTATAAVFTRTAQKNRAAGTNAILAGSFSAGAPAAGVLVQNTTAAKGSRAFVYKTAGGANWNMCQPLAPSSAEIDTWATNDTVNLLALVAVNLVRFSPTIAEFNGSFTNTGLISQLTVLDPGGVGFDNMYIGAVECIDVNFQRCLCSDETAIVPGASTAGGFTPQFINCFFAGSMAWQSSHAFQINGGAIPATAGTIAPILSPLATSTAASAVLDGDFILGNAATIGNVTIGLVYMDASIVVPSGAYVRFATVSYGSHVLYGNAAPTLSFQGNSRGVMVSGTWAAGWTAPTLVTGVTMNGGTTAQTHTNATPDVVTSGVTTSVANADAAPGGTMLVWGGASISKAA